MLQGLAFQEGLQGLCHVRWVAVTVPSGDVEWVAEAILRKPGYGSLEPL